ncbi:MAG: CHASE2 domain-containing protein [Prochloraceae cyanobacterium]|nr:CHASE2 domain-containing protein [Prochloraceae cyanobacterium]
MTNLLKLLNPKIDKRLLRSIVLIVIFPIVVLRLLGFLQWMEWAFYDLLFYFSASESKEERIVLVVWTEKDIQKLQESIIPDQTLGILLEKIKKQQPRLIGLDLYRDLPVVSGQLSKQENQAAYKNLQEIFRSTPNLLGIEKVLPPTTNPPSGIKRVTSSDIITDDDNIIRRSFIDPRPRTKKDDPNTERGVTYLGTALGYHYLAKEGWNGKLIGRGSYLIFKNETQITLKDIKTFDGGYINNKMGWDFLVNWRRGNNLFIKYSVTEVIDGAIPVNIFQDKIVLIGNVSSSSTDIHYLPTKKWDKYQKWTYGVEIPAQVASSIISAALDNRPLLKVAPWGMGYILLLVATSTMTFLILKFSSLKIDKLYLISGFFSLCFTCLLSVTSLVAFQMMGWWIPIIPSILGIWLTFMAINNYVQIDKERQNVLWLKLLANYLNHKFGNSSSLIKFNTEYIEECTQIIEQISFSIYKKLEKEHQEYYGNFSDSNFSETKEAQDLNNLLKKLSEIEATNPKILGQIQKITTYRERTTEFMELANKRKQRNSGKININEFIHQIIEQTLSDLRSEYEYQVLVEEVYDPSWSLAKVDRTALEIIIENLLDNAFYAVKPENHLGNNYSPTIKVKTKNSQKFLEIRVEDNGSGIPLSRQKKIFEPLVSYKSGRGQGIGLFLVKELLDIEHGKIRVESEVGKGSKFIVLLPKK